MPIGHPITAAAQRVRFTKRSLAKVADTPLEDRVWAVYDRLPEIHYGVNIRSHIAEKFDYFPARRATPVSEPDRLGETEEGAPVSAQDRAVIEVLEAEGGTDLLRRLVTDLVVHFDIPGRAFLVAQGDPREWAIFSTQELRREGTQVRKISSEGQILPDEEPIDPAEVFVVWRPHPRNRQISDSPLKATIEVAEQLVLLNREMRARSLSRISAGILWLPDGMDMSADEDEDNPTISFEQEFTDALTRPIKDEGSAGSVAPWVVSADPEDIEKVRHQTFDRDWDISRDDREELIRRLANGMDLPPEILLGMADTNHWTAWQVNESAVSQHVDPTVRDILDSLTTGWFRPLLEAARVDPTGVVLWRDITPAIVPADRTDQHFRALSDGLIGFDAARERIGYDDEEKPDLNELELIGWLKGRGDPSTGVPVEIGGEPPDRVSPVRGPAQTPRPGTEEPEEAALVGPGFMPVAEDSADPFAAAFQEVPTSLIPSRTVTLDALAALDASALDFVLTEAEAALDRVLEKAGARIRSTAQGNPELRKALADIPNSGLIPEMVSRTFQAEDLVTLEDFDTVMARIKARLARTQTETRAVLEEVTEQPVPATPDEEQDLEEGTTKIRNVLLAAAIAALFTPSADPDPADVGEVLDRRLPVSEIRDGISRVGGGPASYSDSGTWELIGNGRRSNETLTDAGASSLSFKWQYGATPRVTNFEPHRRLDGRSFESWEADVLEQSGSGSWVAGSHFRPGDHRGCLCRYVREVTLRV